MRHREENPGPAQADLIRAMESAFAQCPAVAAKITFDTDQREVTVDYNPLWLERQKMTGRGWAAWREE